MNRFWWAGVAAWVVLALLPGCRATGPVALHPVPSTLDELAPLRPGQGLGILDLHLVNDADQTITITEIKLEGVGISEVGSIKRLAIAPMESSASTVPSALYVTDPPVDGDSKVCIVQTLVPYRGYVIKPGTEGAQVWVVVRFLRPGRFSIDGYRVSYEIGGQTQSQWMPYQFLTSVRVSAPRRRPSNFETPCLDRTHLL